MQILVCLVFSLVDSCSPLRCGYYRMFTRTVDAGSFIQHNPTSHALGDVVIYSHDYWWLADYDNVVFVISLKT